MTNRIQQLIISSTRVDPTKAELWVSVLPERLDSDTTLRGRFVGPRCVYASTIEVAYPLQQRLRKYAAEDIPRIGASVVIPEPCLWDPVSPFLYEGTIELWQGKDCCERRSLTYGLRTVGAGLRGLLWNRQPLTLRGTTNVPGSEAEARTLHETGCNTLLLARPEDAADLWNIGNQFGLLMLVRLTGREQIPAIALEDRACGLGYLVPWELWRDDALVREGLPQIARPLLGVELREPPPEPLPNTISFVACTEDDRPALTGVVRPKLILGKQWTADVPARPGICGWIAP